MMRDRVGRSSVEMSGDDQGKRENPKLHLEFNPARLAEIIGSAVFVSAEVVNLHFKALIEDNLKLSLERSGVVYKFTGPDLSFDQRRTLHENWVLARAFQELLRAVREALEEAHVVIALVTGKHKVRSNETLEGFLGPFRKKARNLSFPELLAAVNQLLNPKLDFAESYESLQLARNCLEHRAGVVGKTEAKGKTEFVLRFPRVKIFYLRGKEEIEVVAGERVVSGDERPEVEVSMRFEIRERSIPVGTRLAFTLNEFNEIAFACNFFGQQLAARLPKPKIDVP